MHAAKLCQLHDIAQFKSHLEMEEEELKRKFELKQQERKAILSCIVFVIWNTEVPLFRGKLCMDSYGTMLGHRKVSAIEIFAIQGVRYKRFHCNSVCLEIFAVQNFRGRNT